MEPHAPVICAWLPGFALRVCAHRQADLSTPVALASTLDVHPVVRACTPAAQREGVVPGMLVSRALGACSGLAVLAWNDEAVAQAAEQFVVRLESVGAAVHPMEPGRAVFAARPLERLHGGLEGVLAAVRRCFRTDALRLGVGPNPFVAWVAARHARPGQHVSIQADEAARVLAGMPISLVEPDARTRDLLAALGLHTLGAFASIAPTHIADRFGEEGLRLHELARGVDTTLLQPRVPVEPVEETLQFPEPMGQVDVLHRALRLLVERAVGHPRCVQHAPGLVVVVCGMVHAGGGLVEAGGGMVHARGSAQQHAVLSHRAERALRTPTLSVERILLAARTVFDDVPAPVEQLTVRLERFEPMNVAQGALFGTRGTALTGADSGAELAGIADPRVQAGLRHVQAVVGDDAVLQVLEMQPDSRIPERHVVLVPRSEHGEGGVS